MSFTAYLEALMRRTDLDVDHVTLLAHINELNMSMYRACRLAAFQQEQLRRLAQLVPLEHRAEVALILASGDERGEAIVEDWFAWAGSGLQQMLGAAGLPIEPGE